MASIVNGAPVACPLAGVVGDWAQDPGPLVSGVNATYRTLVSSITSSTPIDGVEDTWTRPVVYKVGVPSVADRILQRAGAGWVRPDQRFATAELVRAEASAAVGRNALFTTAYEQMDFSGVVEQLAASVAVYAAYGILTGAMIRAGADISVVSTEYIGHPIATNGAQVFVARCTDRPMRASTFFALMCAINACGSGVVTDQMHVSLDRGTPMVAACEGLDLAIACWEALHCLGANMHASGAGAIWATALTCGIHRGATVVGHTDEGGWVRNVLRRGKYAAPVGVVLDSHRDVVGLPRVLGRSRAGLCSLVDGIALATAGMVAVSDPLVEVRGAMLPTVCYASAGVEEGGAVVAGAQAMGNAIHDDIGHTWGQFSAIYVRKLGELFAVATTDANYVVAARGLGAKFMSLAGVRDQHLEHAVVHPYFWVEPVPVVPACVADSAATTAGWACFASPGRDGYIPLLGEGGSVTDTRVGMVAVHAAYTGLRKSGLAMHFGHCPRNGLGAVQVIQADPEQFITPGGADGDGSMHARMTAGVDLAAMSWGRGHSMLMAPGEALYTGTSGLHLVLTLERYDAQTRIFTREHLPSVAELSGSVRFVVGRPCGLGLVGPMDAVVLPRAVRRARSLGVVTLGDVRARMRSARNSGSGTWQVRFVDSPDILAVRAVTAEVTAVAPETGPPMAVNSEEVHDLAEGPRLQAVGAMAAHRAPRVPAGRAGGGGGADGGGRAGRAPGEGPGAVQDDGMEDGGLPLAVAPVAGPIPGGALEVRAGAPALDPGGVVGAGVGLAHIEVDPVAPAGPGGAGQHQ